MILEDLEGAERGSSSKSLMSEGRFMVLTLLNLLVGTLAVLCSWLLADAGMDVIRRCRS
jgi:hypothetical protein